jgi:hypothetical protein
MALSSAFELIFSWEIFVLWPCFRDTEQSTAKERAKVVSGVALSTILKTRGMAVPGGERRLESILRTDSRAGGLPLREAEHSNPAG